MRIFAAWILIASLPVLGADSSEEKAVTGVVQKLFDAMAAHDTAAVLAVVIPDGRIVSIGADGTVRATSQEQFATRMGGIKNAILERMWNPKVLIEGRIAQVWAEYDFWSNGKFGHCGIDSVSLAKGAEGWKISGITYTNQTEGCTPSPLGPPPGAAKN